MRTVQARKMRSKERAIDADEERVYKLNCELHPIELDLNKTERGVIKHPTLVLFLV